MNPHISIIIPTYNRANIIFKTLKSVFNQTYKNYEIIIADDGSTDNTENIIKLLQKKHKNLFYYYKKKNQGSASARNLGVRYSKGKYIAFLDSDDLWKKNHLKDSIKFLENNDIDLMFSRIEFSLSNKNNKELLEKVRNIIFKIPHKKNKNKIIFNNSIFNYLLEKGHLTIAPSTWMAKTNIIKKYKSNEKLINGQDYELLLRISRNNKIGYLDKKNVIYVFHSSNITKNRKKVNKNQIIKWKEILKYSNLTIKQKRLIYYHIRTCYLNLLDIYKNEKIYLFYLFYLIRNFFNFCIIKISKFFELNNQ